MGRLDDVKVGDRLVVRTGGYSIRAIRVEVVSVTATQFKVTGGGYVATAFLKSTGRKVGDGSYRYGAEISFYAGPGRYGVPETWEELAEKEAQMEVEKAHANLVHQARDFTYNDFDRLSNEELAGLIALVKSKRGVQND